MEGGGRGKGGVREGVGTLDSWKNGESITEGIVFIALANGRMVLY